MGVIIVILGKIQTNLNFLYNLKAGTRSADVQHPPTEPAQRDLGGNLSVPAYVKIYSLKMNRANNRMRSSSIAIRKPDLGVFHLFELPTSGD